MTNVTSAAPNESKQADVDLALLHLALPKGRMHDGVLAILKEAGVSVRSSERGYRPTVSLPNVETKILKPQNVIEMLAAGSRDLGFAGKDWIEELEVSDRVVELLDTGLDPVRVVLAAPVAFLSNDGKLPLGRHVRIATEYARLTQEYIDTNGLDASIVRSRGATEVFPPEDADAIVDNTATGSTLRANGMAIIDDVMASSTRVYASAKAWENPAKRQRIEEIVMLLRSVVEARKRVMLTLNVPREQFDAVLEMLPCMREPTVAELAHDQGYSISSAVLRKDLTVLIPKLKEAGGTDLIVSPINQIVP
ncbi:MAG: ATP phosphoribosyltransferase [Planctomycetota bacterium]